VAYLCEHGNKPPCSVKAGHFLFDEGHLACIEGFFFMESWQ
jgi:hypothetical protein